MDPFDFSGENAAVSGGTMICFAHISDLHFGSKMITGGLQVPYQSPHDLAKCLALPRGLMTAIDVADLDDEEELRVVASGDMTVSGTTDELAIAHAYMRSRPQFARLGTPFDAMGLNLPGVRLGIIPGNHDHWDGNRTNLTPHNPNLFDDHFRKTPWSKAWTSNSNEARVEIFGVDSNSGWAANLGSTTRRRISGFMARGRISAAEFASLEQKLAASFQQPVQTVRVITCHHSVSYQQGIAGKLALEQASVDKLLDLAARYHVAAILTGHTHDSYAHTFQRPDQDGNAWYVTELRCASTLSTDSPNEERGFLMNRVEADAIGWQWTVWRYGWAGARFVGDPNGPWQQFRGAY